ncbi:AT-rich interactive domain-containing protein 5-like isoform X2 [Iris pallida]|uniref:AT-rich interactive domain-containing protein 5-like isoform X2 n=1 Tax=Iris pallida TaxID=29817 RepID=A0AAX6FEW5_IRIPA|nr:AT-rich interactive domain-containing protein 5-like isoform X2 [Iris pallida]
MSEPTDNNNVPEEEMPGVPDDERTVAEVAEVEDEQLPDVVSDPLERGSSQLQTEADVGNGNHDSVEPSSPGKILVEALLVPDVPVNHPGSNAGFDEKTNMDEQLDDGNGLLESDANKPVPSEENEFKETAVKEERDGGDMDGDASGDGPIHSFSFDPDFLAGDNDGSEEEQAAFMKELEKFHKERSLEFKPPKFYGEGLNCLKLWRAVTRLGGYDQVTICKLWRQVGESFKPPKTCTTVSWSFRCFYEKALLEYEKHKIRTGELHVPLPSLPEPMAVDSQGGNQASGSGRARRDAAARAMQGWHSQRLLGNGEVGDPIIKDKSAISLLKKDNYLKSFGSPPKKKKGSSLDRSVKVARTKGIKPHVDSVVVDVGQPADWVKICAKD